MALRLRQMELSAKTMYGHVLKITQHSAHAQNHVSIERCRKPFTTIVLGDHHPPLIALNFVNLTALGQFLAIYELPVIIGHDISAIRLRFLLIFALDKLNVCHVSSFVLVTGSIARSAHLPVFRLLRGRF